MADCRFASYSLNLFLYQNYFLLISQREEIAFSDTGHFVEEAERKGRERIWWLAWNFIHAIDTHALTTNAVRFLRWQLMHCMLASQSHRMNDFVLAFAQLRSNSFFGFFIFLLRFFRLIYVSSISFCCRCYGMAVDVVVKRDSNHFKSAQITKSIVEGAAQHTNCVAEDESEAKEKEEAKKPFSQVKILSSSRKENLENV